MPRLRVILGASRRVFLVLMQTLEEALRAGTLALREGDAGRARAHFTAAAAVDLNSVPALLGIARSCAALRDAEAQGKALDRLLSLDPRNLSGLVMRGDRFAAAGDLRSAASFYQSALRHASQSSPQPPEVMADLQRARHMCDEYAAHYSAYIETQLQARGFDPTTSSARFAQSVDVVLGRKRIFVQQPKYYYFPGLPQIQFYERDHFPWLETLERATSDIREELLGVLNEPSAFAPYVQGDANRPRKDQMGMLNNPDWSAFYLIKNGEVVADNAGRCPKTMQAIQDLPLARVPNRSPSVLFSLLQPGAHIPAHNGLVNTRLICHLPLIVPGPCRFRVGNETRLWKTGQAWLFDDSIEHEAWNETDQSRVILLFDVWRPELSAEERRLVTALFESIDAHSGRKPEWSI